jgi:hypothetical protein
VQSICDYLYSPNGTIEIHDNGPGCNSREEVIIACDVGIEQPGNSTIGQQSINIYPIPSSSIITIKLPGNKSPKNTVLTIYNVDMQQVM